MLRIMMRQKSVRTFIMEQKKGLKDYMEGRKKG